jgi:glutamate racemase
MLGVFDSGVGGLTVLRDIQRALPSADTLYLGDSALAPYGSKSHDELVACTWDGVRWLFDQGCHLVIVACNSASAGALREIQQTKLRTYPGRRVLGVIRPTVETLVRDGYRNIVVLSTTATRNSGAYAAEFHKLDPTLRVISHACPNWATLIEQGKASSSEMTADIKKEISALEADIAAYDAVLLGCTHYPFIKDQIASALSHPAPIFSQGELVAASLVDYLNRHPDLAATIGDKRRHRYVTTGDIKHVSRIASDYFKFDATFERTDLVP